MTPRLLTTNSGSQDELDHLDAHLIGVTTGRFRRLSRGDQVIMTIRDGGWSASGRRRLPDIDKVLADPYGWDELTGVAWL